MRHNTTEQNKDVHADNSINAAELADRAFGLVADPEDGLKDHNTSYPSYDSDVQRNITPEVGLSTKEIPELSELEKAIFWRQVGPGGINDCWLWEGSTTTTAYSPNIFYGQFKHFKVHRIAYSLLVGPIPESLTIDHVKGRGCTSTLCCNPRHLEAISQTEQIRRRDAHRVDGYGMTKCIHGHPRMIGRPCQGCGQLNAAKHRAKVKGEPA